LFHLFPFLFYSFCVFTFFLVYVCFMFLFFLFLFCLSSFFLFLCIYLFIFFFLFQKDSSFFNMFYNENIFFLNYIFVWLYVGPPVFPKDFFNRNRNGTSRGPPQRLPWPPCPAMPLPCLSPAPQGTSSDWKNLPGTAQFLSTQTDERTPCLLLYIRCNFKECVDDRSVGSLELLNKLINEFTKLTRWLHQWEWWRSWVKGRLQISSKMSSQGSRITSSTIFHCILPPYARVLFKTSPPLALLWMYT
jgi:hypothetical protein